MALIVYRVVRANPPTAEQFRSAKALRVQLRHRTQRALHLYDGVSTWTTFEAAAALSRQNPARGRYIAELHIPEDGSVRFELDPRGHCTLWGEPARLLQYVVNVHPVDVEGG